MANRKKYKLKGWAKPTHILIPEGDYSPSFRAESSHCLKIFFGYNKEIQSTDRIQRKFMGGLTRIGICP